MIIQNNETMPNTPQGYVCAGHVTTDASGDGIITFKGDVSSKITGISLTPTVDEAGNVAVTAHVKSIAYSAGVTTMTINAVSASGDLDQTAFVAHAGRVDYMCFIVEGTMPAAASLIDNDPNNF